MLLFSVDPTINAMVHDILVRNNIDTISNYIELVWDTSPLKTIRTKITHDY